MWNKIRDVVTKRAVLIFFSSHSCYFSFRREYVKINMGTGKYLEALSFNGSLRRRCPTCCAFHLRGTVYFRESHPICTSKFHTNCFLFDICPGREGDTVIPLVKHLSKADAFCPNALPLARNFHVCLSTRDNRERAPYGVSSYF